MASIFFARRPSALLAARPLVVPARHGVRHLAAAYGVVGVAHNSIGTPAVLAEGAPASGLATLAGMTAGQRIGADQAKGSNARGNPPRGRRRV